MIGARRLVGWVDPFLAALLLALAAGLLVPVGDGVRAGLGVASDVAVTLLFLLYGMRLPTSEVLAGLRNVRLQGSVLAATYLLFPAVGLLLALVTRPLLGDTLATGFLYVSLLPSTVQSSVVFTATGRGNVAGAVCAATVSNTLGVVLTPLLVLALLRSDGVAPDATAVGDIALRLVLPFVVGQLLERRLGARVRAHPRVTTITDRGTVVLVLFTAVVGATADGSWDALTPWRFAGILAVSAVLLVVMLVLTWTGGRLVGLDRPDRVALLMCGSKKSLATGLPMATVIFGATTAATLALPLIVFHQLQLMVGAVLARRLGRAPLGQ